MTANLACSGPPGIPIRWARNQGIQARPALTVEERLCALLPLDETEGQYQSFPNRGEHGRRPRIFCRSIFAQ
jgi:hypothetical protein